MLPTPTPLLYREIQLTRPRLTVIIDFGDKHVDNLPGSQRFYF